MFVDNSHPAEPKKLWKNPNFKKKLLKIGSEDLTGGGYDILKLIYTFPTTCLVWIWYHCIENQECRGGHTMGTVNFRSVMKKFAVVVLIVFCCLFCLAGCGYASAEYDSAKSEAMKVPTEVNGVNFLSEDGITVNGTYIDFKAEEKKLVDCKPLEFQDSYYEWCRYTEDGLIFSHQYAHRGDHIRENDSLVENAHRIDVGIFKVDGRSGKLTLLKDIKDIVPFNLYDVAHLPVTHGRIDERYIVLTYNGLLEVVDAENGETVFSAQVYSDPVKYARTENGANAYFDGRDYAFLDEGVLDYYVYGDGVYEKVSFSDPAITEKASAERYGDTIFVKDSERIVGEVVFAVDMETGEKLPEEDMQKRFDEAVQNAENKENEPTAPPEYKIGSKTYAIEETLEQEQGYNSSEFDRCTLTLTEVSTGEKRTIDGELLAKNSAFVRLKEIYEEYYAETEWEFTLRRWNVNCERLFLTVYRPLEKVYSFPIYSPAFIFEYIPETDEIKYCGMSEDTFALSYVAAE